MQDAVPGDPDPAARRHQAGASAGGQKRQRSPVCAALSLAHLPVLRTGVGSVASIGPSWGPRGSAGAQAAPPTCGMWASVGAAVTVHRPPGRPDPHARAAESFTKSVGPVSICLFPKAKDGHTDRMFLREVPGLGQP